MPRIFVGTFLSDEGVDKLAKLSQANEHLCETWNAKVRWVDRSKFHITWVFLGEIGTEKIPQIIESLSEAFEKPDDSRELLTVVYDRFELWPSERKARLAVVTPSTVPEQVLELDSKIKTAVKSFLPAVETPHELNVFKPHLTVLRFPRDHRHEKNVKPKRSDVQIPDSLFPIRHDIKEFSLIESELGKPIDGYIKLATFTLM
jgi:2'-5' RNA ligase